MMKNLEKTVRGAKPFKQVPFEAHLQAAYESAMSKREVRIMLANATPEQKREIIERLAYHVNGVRKESNLLRYSAGALDTLDRASRPLENATQTELITYPISIGLKLARWPLKALHSLHYAIKAREPTAPIKDAAWETTSLAVPGKIADMTGRYADRVANYVAPEAARRLVKELKSKKKKRFVDIAEEFRPETQRTDNYEDYNKTREEKIFSRN